MDKYEKQEKNRIKRVPKRASYDKPSVYEILDDNFLCHVAFSGQETPFVIPTIYGRKGDSIFLHGSVKSRLMNKVKEGIPVCISVAMVDGLVLARSVFHHSANYRSVVLFGMAVEVTDDKAKHDAFEVITENVLKGRWKEARQPNNKELNVTAVMEVKIETATAKVRTGGPVDEKSDYELNVWAGVLPIQKTYGEPITDELSKKEISVSESVISELIRSN
jgi:nitroimidazol reductase NimA-like FMN-containing flavoprotein (pyridoxamine 5'-phosphate oxidase superfamily)